MKYQFHLWPQDRYTSLDDLGSVVEAGERLGYAAVASGEHVIVPTAHADMIGTTYYDPMVLFAYLAGRTTTIGLQYSTLR